MPLYPSWQQIALRLALASLASFLIGLNRDEHGHPAGMRTTMLVCLAATLAMLQVNLLLPIAGRPSSSFVMNDLMRLPLGILSGIGFIGAGAILKHKDNIRGVTTAATLWYVTVLGLLFGGGNLWLGTAGSVIALLVLLALKGVERILPRYHTGCLHLELTAGSPDENEIRRRLVSAEVEIVTWGPHFSPPDTLVALQCEVRWMAKRRHSADTPDAIEKLRSLPGVVSLNWKG